MMTASTLRLPGHRSGLLGRWHALTAFARDPLTSNELAAEARSIVVMESVVPELAHLTLSLVVAVLIYGTVNLATIISWVAIIFGCTAVRDVYRRRLTVALEHKAVGQAEYRVIRGSIALLGIAWGLGGGLAAAQLELQTVGLIMVILSGLLAGASSTLAADRPLFRFFLVTLLAPLAIGLAVNGLDKPHAVALFLVLLFGACMLSVHSKTHQGLIERLRSIGQLALTHQVSARQRAHMEALLSFAPAAIVVVNARGRVERINSRFTTLFEFQSNEVIGRDLNELIVPARERSEAQSLEQEVQSGRGVVKEVMRCRKGGALTPVRVSAAQVAGSNELFVIYEDISGEVASRQALTDARNAAEAANQAKSAFLANMSHELRTPLNSVIGFSAMLLKNKSAALTSQDLLFSQRIHDNGRHLLGLINNVLDLSKVEAGRMELELRDTMLDELVRATVDEMRSQVGGRPIALIADLPSFPIRFVTDTVKLKQVIINLVGNALKFTHEGSITVRVTANEANGQPVRLEVVDTGIGIPEDRQAAVFEAFQQADISTSRQYGGTGLGLTITRSLCRLMGYELTLSSVVGTGTTFAIHF